MTLSDYYSYPILAERTSEVNHVEVGYVQKRPNLD